MNNSAHQTSALNRSVSHGESTKNPAKAGFLSIPAGKLLERFYPYKNPPDIISIYEHIR